MRPEEQLFLQILRDHVQGVPSRFDPAEVSADALAELASQQGVAGIVYAQCREILIREPQVLLLLQQSFAGGVFQSTCLAADYREVSAVLREAKIPFLPVKGAAFAEDYPVPELRTMGDIDLVIRPEDRQRTHQLMESMGFACTVDNHAVWTYHRDVTVYEIHDHLFYEELAGKVNYRAYFDGVWEHAAPVEGSEYRLQPEMHFLYLMAHTAKHILNHGSGVRPFLDMVFFCRKETLDWTWITAELQRLQLLEFTRTCFALCRHWFGAELPLENIGLKEEFLRSATEKMLRDGVFGLENPENETGAAAKNMNRAGGPYLLTALGMTLRKIFPPYRDMQLIPWYSFVNGRPWLLPFAWVYRWWYCLRHKLVHSRELLAQPFARKEEILKRQELIRAWGLDGAEDREGQSGL